LPQRHRGTEAQRHREDEKIEKKRKKRSRVNGREG
jgi:hypothetical protein